MIRLANEIIFSRLEPLAVDDPELVPPPPPPVHCPPSGPLPAGHAGLVRIKAGLDRTLQLAELGLDHTRTKEPVKAIELRADRVGMHESVPLSDPVDRVSGLALAGMLGG